MSIQMIVFILISLLLLPLLFKKYLPLPGLKHTLTPSIQALIGSKCTVIESIGPDQHSGIVKLDGEKWIAFSTTGQPIPKGSIVVADHIKGVRLFVSLSSK